MSEGLGISRLAQRGWGLCAAGERRSRRVMVLLAGVVLLSLADLVVTLAYIQANWMMEANPLASWIIHNTEPVSSGLTAAALGAFKIGTLTVCVAVLFRLRRHMAGEVAAWTAVGVLTVMSVMWHHYAAHFDQADAVMLAHMCQQVNVAP
jgi:hypothetical protein